MFGKQISAFRQQYGWTQADLAKRVRVSKRAVNNWETDVSNPSAICIIRLAEVFAVSTDSLLGISDQDTIDLSCLSERDRQALRAMFNAFIQIARQ